MKKSNNKGYMLVETLVATTIIVTALLFLYVQYSNITKNYRESFSYNTTNNLYGAYNLKKYILEDGYNTLVEELENHDYVDITDCSSNYFVDEDYCEVLISSMEIKQVFFTTEDVSNIDFEVNDAFKSFIKKIVYDDVEEHRLLIEFNDETFATVLVSKLPAREYVVKNLIMNGGLNSVAGWTFSNGSGYTISGGNVSYNFVGNWNDVVGQNIKLTALDNDKFYMRITARPSHNNYRVGFGTNSGGNNTFIAETLGYNGVNFITSSFVVMPGHHFNEFYFGLYNAGSSGTMAFDNALVINLTDIFGQGKEPSKIWCDNNIPFFDGTMTITY